MTEPRTPPDQGPDPDPSAWDIYYALPVVVRRVLVAVLLLALVAGVATLAGAGLVRRPLPEVSGDVELPGLDADVEVLRDEHGIPQVYARTTGDLMRAQGYVHAQERFYEMDVRRHATSGRLAELFGEDAVEADLMVRTMGWRRVAEEELGLVSPDTRRALTAYAEGVNAYLAEHETGQIAVEYTVLAAAGLEYTPEQWTPADSLAWLKAMAWDLRANVEDEIARALAAADHTPAEVAQLWPRSDTGPPVVDQGAVVDGVFEPDAVRGGSRNPQRPGWHAWTPRQRRALAAAGRAVDSVPPLLGRGDGIGSNAWVVGPDRTATGTPLLANDPHLGVSLPGVWMQMGLHCTEVGPECPMDVAGFTFSGVPGVVIGHNADIAWGMTNLGADVADLYLERVRGDRWRYDGRWRPMRVRTERVRVRGREDVRLRIRETRHGPLLSDVSRRLSTVGANASQGDARPDGRHPRAYAVALEWTALRPMPTADAILGINTASGWEEFREAAADFSVPAQNLVYADRRGHIGYQAPGWVPIRKSGNDGSVPARGWLPENDWTGERVPFEGLPHVLDPEDGFVVTANQRVAPRRYPYDLTTDWDHGLRAARLRRLLEDRSGLTVAETARLQLDDRHPLAPVLVPHLLAVDDLGSGYLRDGQQLLADWDFGQSADSAGAAYFNAVWRHLLANTFHDDLRGDLWPDGGDRWMVVVEDLLARPGSSWWDDRFTDDVVETRDDVLAAALRDARDDLTAHVSLDPDKWRWGALHRLDLENSTVGQSGVDVAEWLVNRDGFSVGGSGAAVNATAWDAAEGYAVTSAPSMRMVVAPGRWDESRWVSITGVSGHPFSGHYTDQTEVWAAGGTLPWHWSRSRVRDAADDTLRLVPAAPPG